MDGIERRHRLSLFRQRAEAARRMEARAASPEMRAHYHGIASFWERMVARLDHRHGTPPDRVRA
jgi:hypothetical protein